jgi:hypothetical protein
MKLKPCPFCGKEPGYWMNFNGRMEVSCDNPKCAVRPDACGNPNKNSARLAAQRWNKRAEVKK